MIPVIMPQAYKGNVAIVLEIVLEIQIASKHVFVQYMFTIIIIIIIVS